MSLYGAAVAVVRVLAKLLFRVKVTGEKHLPEGPVVLCPNHMSYMDPVFVATSIDRRITAVAKASLFDKPFIGWRFKKLEIIPVNRDGGDFGAVRTAVKALKDGRVLVVFPQGTRVMKKPLDDSLVRGGASMMAIKGGAKIVPMSIYTKKYRVLPFRKVYVNIGKGFEPSELYDGVNDKNFTVLSKKIFERVMELDAETRESLKK
jgi:1-acyl-sn-glycerol-3-phosphate acyltransferase